MLFTWYVHSRFKFQHNWTTSNDVKCVFTFHCSFENLGGVLQVISHNQFTMLKSVAIRAGEEGKPTSKTLEKIQTSVAGLH